MERIEVCHLAGATFGRQVYIVILTAKTESQDLVTAMKAGADDYVTKSFRSQGLRFRLAAGCRILDLEKQLALSVGPVPRRHGRGMSSPHGEVDSFAANPAPGMFREVN